MSVNYATILPGYLGSKPCCYLKYYYLVLFYLTSCPVIPEEAPVHPSICPDGIAAEAGQQC